MTVIKRRIRHLHEAPPALELVTSDYIPFPARATDPDTSQEAARFIYAHLDNLGQRVTAFLAENDRLQGWTSDEVNEAFGRHEGLHRRLGECARRGWLRLATRRDGEVIKRAGRFSGGARQRAYRITDAGRAAVEGQ